VIYLIGVDLCGILVLVVIPFRWNNDLATKLRLRLAGINPGINPAPMQERGSVALYALQITSS
jgi:hypothetical protein